MQKLIIIAGPTASGKTALAVNVAKSINGEVISADSMQIYKYMSIGSAKPTIEEMQGIPHHLIDFLDPKSSFSVSEYQQKAKQTITDIISRGKTPIVCGGTGLYINSIIYPLDFTSSKADVIYREHLSTLARENGNQYIYDLLLECDPATANKLHPNDTNRIIRALEIFHTQGITKSEQTKEFNSFVPQYDLCYIGLNMDRQRLYDRINLRVDIMLQNGLLEEVQALKDSGCTPDMQAMKGIGYKELLWYLDGKITLDTAIETIKQESRRYAKRQLTWFRRDPNISWLITDNLSEHEKHNKAIEMIQEWQNGINK